MQPTQAYQGHSFMQWDTDQQETRDKKEVEESGKKCVGVDLPKRLPYMSGHKSLQAYMLTKQDLASMLSLSGDDLHTLCSSTATVC